MLNLKTAAKSVIRTVAPRVGAIVGTWLVATWGVDGDLATQIASGVVATFLIGGDKLTETWLKS